MAKDCHTFLNGTFYPNLNVWFKGCSLSEARNLASIKPQYDKRLFIELPVQTTSAEHGQNMGRTCSALVVFMVIP